MVMITTSISAGQLPISLKHLSARRLPDAIYYWFKIGLIVLRVISTSAIYIIDECSAFKKRKFMRQIIKRFAHCLIASTVCRRFNIFQKMRK